MKTSSASHGSSSEELVLDSISSRIVFKRKVSNNASYLHYLVNMKTVLY